MLTLDPNCNNFRTISRPMPLAPPVMITFLPSKFIPQTISSVVQQFANIQILMITGYNLSCADTA